jgi:hypothetical protein
VKVKAAGTLGEGTGVILTLAWRDWKIVKNILVSLVWPLSAQREFHENPSVGHCPSDVNNLIGQLVATFLMSQRHFSDVHI